jgi:hypothetical protein
VPQLHHVHTSNRCHQEGAGTIPTNPHNTALLLLLLLLWPTVSVADAAGVAEVPEGQLLEVEFTLSELHRVDTPAPGVTKKVLAEPEGNYMKPNDGSTVTILVSTRSVDGATVYEEEKEVTFTTDEEQVG